MTVQLVFKTLYALDKAYKTGRIGKEFWKAKRTELKKEKQSPKNILKELKEKQSGKGKGSRKAAKQEKRIGKSLSDSSLLQKIGPPKYKMAKGGLVKGPNS